MARYSAPRLIFFCTNCATSESIKSSASTRVGFFLVLPLPTSLASASCRCAKRRLPYRTESARYSLEYGEAEMELHIDAIEHGEKVVLIDDLLATGGTSASAATLIKKVGGDLIEAIFLIELEFLHGREKLAPTPVTSFLKY